MAGTDSHPNGALRGVVAVGASAGGVEALTKFVAGLAEDLPYAFLIALHLPAEVMLSEGPTENGHRPAINALFRSVALTFGPQAIGVLLSGVLESLGPHSGYTCPDCNGSLMTVSENNYRCRVGHAWTADALLNARDDEVENALWVALRSLQEKAKLSRKLAETVGPGMLSRRYTQLAEEAEHAVLVLGKRLSKTCGPGERGAG